MISSLCAWTFSFLYFYLLWVQGITGQLTGKALSGGTGSRTKAWTILVPIWLSWATQLEWSSPTWPSWTHHFGPSTLFTAGLLLFHFSSLSICLRLCYRNCVKYAKEVENCFCWMNSQVLVQNLTILAPLDSPNTDGIDPGEHRNRSGNFSPGKTVTNRVKCCVVFIVLLLLAKFENTKGNLYGNNKWFYSYRWWLFFNE